MCASLFQTKLQFGRKDPLILYLEEGIFGQLTKTPPIKQPHTCGNGTFQISFNSVMTTSISLLPSTPKHSIKAMQQTHPLQHKTAF